MEPTDGLHHNSSLASRAAALNENATDFYEATKSLNQHQKNLSQNTDTILQNHWLADTPIGEKAKNLKASFMALQEGILIANDLATTCIKKAEGIQKIPVAIGAGLGFALYGLNLLAATVLKTAVWLPVLATITVSGLLGGVLGAVLGLGNPEKIKNGVFAGAMISDWVLSGTLFMLGALTSSWIQPLLMLPPLFLLKFLEKKTSGHEESLQTDQLQAVVLKLQLLDPSHSQSSSLPFGILNSRKDSEMVEALQFLHTIHDLNAITADGKPALLCNAIGEMRDKFALAQITKGLVKANLLSQLNSNTFDELINNLNPSNKSSQNALSQMDNETLDALRSQAQALKSEKHLEILTEYVTKSLSS